MAKPTTGVDANRVFDLWAVINAAESRLGELRVNGNPDEDSLAEVGRVLRVAAQLAYAIGNDMCDAEVGHG